MGVWGCLRVNYYEHHIGDYAAATGHLTLVEDAVYTRMLRRYYLTEAPLPVDVAQLARLVGARQPDEVAAVEAVLAEFFHLQADGWHQKRADEDIERYRAKIDAARENGKRGGRPPNKPSEKGSVNSGSENKTQLKAHQAPDTNHQQEQKQKKGRASAPDLPEWLPPSVWQDWHDYRNSRKGWTPKARALSLQTLTTLWREGHDPRAVIEQAIERGWTGLFPVKTDQQARAGPQQPQPVGKQMQGLMALEAMKSGNRMAAGRGTERAAETVLLVAGSDARR